MTISNPHEHCIRVRGARVHNLRNIDVDIPRDKLVVITGVSGSGKSSLAFDTLFAEGQRRYLESLSTWSRQFLDQLERPDVDHIDGLPPTISVEQRSGSLNPRSTVATTTEIHDYLRLLYARVGTPHCPQCDRSVQRQSVRAIVEKVLALEDRQKVMILAPLVRGRRGAHREVFERIARDGFVRVRIDGQMHEVSDPPELNSRRLHTIDAVVDRLIVKPGIEDRLRESIELAVTRAEGTCLISHQCEDEWRDRLYSTKFSCPDCELSFPPLEPRSFSFNSPYGACEECTGLGTTTGEGTDADTEDSPAETCRTCGGARLSPFPRTVTIAGTACHEFLQLNVREAASYCGSLTEKFDAEHAATPVIEATVSEIAARLTYLDRVGLGYITLDRPAGTLSGGEFQRARLASCVGSQLIGACYILDEPTIGLHPADTVRLIDTLLALRDRGNSVIAVEHDLDVIRAVDHVIDLGPGAGRDGGLVVAAGTPRQIGESRSSVTGMCLRNDRSRPQRTPRPQAETELIVRSARTHNLQGVDVRFPLKRLVAVTGVSGSGKSSLVTSTLVPELRRRLASSAAKSEERPVSACDEIAGVEQIQRLLVIDQSALGRNARSNPATYSDVWKHVRNLFARTRDARIRGFKARRFSFNAKDGRCPECSGHGEKRIEMNFLPDMRVVCPACRGSRFNRQTLAVRFNGRTVADLLAMRFDQAANFFSEIAKLHGILETFCDVGLGYLVLGQSSLTLSGGEAQRVRLATELAQSSRRNSLFVLDEPTTGLHAADVSNLVNLLQRLVDQGHSVIVIEHHPDVIRSADWIIDLGPGSGDDGGRVVAEGTPEQVTAVPESQTGTYLKQPPGLTLPPTLPA